MTSAVEYAEKQLDVHGPWIEAQRRLDLHSQASENVRLAKDEIRALKQSLSDRQFEVTTEAPSTPGYPNAVQARKDFIKLMIAGDPTCNRIEREINHLQSVLDDYQSEVRHHDLGLSVLTARMNELSGLLSFYAAAKLAQTAAAASSQSSLTHTDTQTQEIPA